MGTGMGTGRSVALGNRNSARPEDRIGAIAFYVPGSVPKRNRTYLALGLGEMRVESREHLRAHRPVRVGLVGDHHRGARPTMPSCLTDFTILLTELRVGAGFCFPISFGVRQTWARPRATRWNFPSLPDVHRPRICNQTYLTSFSSFCSS
jgi:hypothetical protein